MARQGYLRVWLGKEDLRFFTPAALLTVLGFLGLGLGLLMCSGNALAQGTAGRCPNTPEKLEGQVLNIDPDRGTVTVRGTDGAAHELQASKETLQQYKVGDRIEAKLRSSPECKKGEMLFGTQAGPAKFATVHVRVRPTTRPVDP